jgi:hypothetical protein
MLLHCLYEPNCCHKKSKETQKRSSRVSGLQARLHSRCFKERLGHGCCDGLGLQTYMHSSGWYVTYLGGVPAQHLHMLAQGLSLCMQATT